jgi:hypothetical protein
MNLFNYFPLRYSTLLFDKHYYTFCNTTTFKSELKNENQQ